jgi:hypothetical protein
MLFLPFSEMFLKDFLMPYKGGEYVRFFAITAKIKIVTLLLRNIDQERLIVKWIKMDKNRFSQVGIDMLSGFWISVKREDQGKRGE